jgi:glycolate oxidase FAD binding subunit
VVDYEPTELVITARAGTPLIEVERTLAGGRQMFAAEPPHFGPGATLGGCVAAGFSGPRRAQAGSVRDFVLGTKVMNAQGETLSFGGQVMKNVAGFDLSRLMTGSFGTLGVLLEISLKVLPLPEEELTLRLALDEAAAIERMNRWAGQPLPISATCFADGQLSVRLSGSSLGIAAARRQIGGDPVPDGAAFWEAVREHRLEAFRQVIEWNGALRWLATDAPAEQVLAAVHGAGGHATRFRSSNPQGAVMQLEPGVLALHRKLKASLDPQGIFGPRRLHPEF